MNKSNIATSLLEASREKAAPKDILADLYPFIFTASERMSGREISEFLEKNHNIQISQPTLARALKDPSSYIAGFAQTAFQCADYVRFSMRLENAGEILWGGSAFARFLIEKAEARIPDTTSLQDEFDAKSIVDCLTDLLESWFSVSENFRQLCRSEVARLIQEQLDAHKRLNEGRTRL